MVCEDKGEEYLKEIKEELRNLNESQGRIEHLLTQQYSRAEKRDMVNRNYLLSTTTVGLGVAGLVFFATILYWLPPGSPLKWLIIIMISSLGFFIISALLRLSGVEPALRSGNPVILNTLAYSGFKGLLSFDVYRNYLNGSKRLFAGAVSYLAGWVCLIVSLIVCLVILPTVF